MDKESTTTPHQRWAHFRFAIVATLLAAPPTRGKLGEKLLELANKKWRHPITGEPVRFSISTIERWFYQARKNADPVNALRRKVRRDSGLNRVLSTPVKEALIQQHRVHPGWSRQLHYDNLVALFRSGDLHGDVPSYPTTRRFMKSAGLFRKRRLARRDSEAARRAEQHLEQREVRAYEVEHANALWHLDFHHGSRQVVLPNGQRITPMLLGVLDDHSRLICHAQWYLAETAENLIHGLCQGFQKRGLPRSIMSDNGSAMTAAETRQGLIRLGILHETTLPYSPYQNGKQEVFWTQVEGRLLPMLEGVPDLNLELLNNATQAWIERGYHQADHSETGQTPIERFLVSNELGRSSPNSQALKETFTLQETRTQRRSDGTITVSGVRFELPSRYRTIQRPTVRYARWNLSRVLLVDPRQDMVLCPLFPQDKLRNADGMRRIHSDAPDDPPPARSDAGMAPLLCELMGEYAATGLPPAYIHKSEPPDYEQNAHPDDDRKGKTP